MMVRTLISGPWSFLCRAKRAENPSLSIMLLVRTRSDARFLNASRLAWIYVCNAVCRGAYILVVERSSYRPLVERTA